MANLIHTRVLCFVPDLEHFPEFIPNTHCIGGYPAQMNAKAWIYELQFENDAWLKSYLLHGITKGFDIFLLLTIVINKRNN